MEIAFAVEWPRLSVVTKIYLAVVALKNTLQKKERKKLRARDQYIQSFNSNAPSSLAR